MSSQQPVVLGIETSCDETGVGIVAGTTLLADEIASSVEQHARFGGVVPEVASRAHLEAMQPTIARALDTAGMALSDVDAVAVTAGPGLSGALLVGVAAAKALAWGAEVPLLGVNHLSAHVAVDTLEHGPIPEPALALLVSGGHTCLLRVDDLASSVHQLGQTMDDAAGEAFDKVARLLGLPFPGGPHIDRAASAAIEAYQQAHPHGETPAPDQSRFHDHGHSHNHSHPHPASAIAFPRGFTAAKDQAAHAHDFSFSGLKTAVARWVEARTAAGESIDSSVVAASFQEAVVEVLVSKSISACKAEGIDTLLIGGGVAANSRLRESAVQRCEKAGITVRIPGRKLCTDNGAMVAALGSHLVAAGQSGSTMDFGADSSMPVEQIRV